MCGRYMLYYDKDVIIDAFNLVNEFDYEERFNIAPSQQVLAIVKGKKGTEQVICNGDLFRSGRRIQRSEIN